MAATDEPKREGSYFKAQASGVSYRRTINDRIRELAVEAPDKVAFVFRIPNQPRSCLTRQEFLDKVTKLGLHFVRLGIKPGDKVGILMTSGEYFLIVQFGLYMAWAVAVNSLSHEENELTEMAATLGCAATIVQNIDASKIESSKQHAVSIFMSSVDDRSKYDFTADVVSLLKTAVPKNTFLPDMPANTRIMMTLTSGTTGVQKLVTHTHSTLLFGTMSFTKELQFNSSDVVVSDRPMQWIGGYPVVFLGLGCTLVYAISQLTRAEDNAFFVHVVSSEKATSSMMMEYRFIGIFGQPELLSKMPRLQSVHMGGQGVTANNVRQMLKIADEIKIFYGSTECCNVSCFLCQDVDSFEDGTVGTFCKGTEVKIVDEQGVIVPVGRVGELHVRGDGISKEYIGLDGTSTDTLDADSWYHTGDMALMKSDCTVIIKGRKTDMIKRATVKIFPAVIERKLQEKLDVQEIVVIGVPDRKLHEEVCACIILKSGSTLTLCDIKGRAEEIFKPSLAPDGLGLMPGHFLIMDDFPRTISSKCAKSQLAKNVVAMLVK